MSDPRDSTLDLDPKFDADGLITAVATHAATGELAITPRELVFSSETRAADVPLERITAIDIADHQIKLAVRGRNKPLIFTVPNGLLWGTLVRNMAQIKTQGRALPAGTQLEM